MPKHVLTLDDVLGNIWLDDHGRIHFRSHVLNLPCIEFNDLVECVKDNIFDDEIDFSGVVTEYNKVKCAG